MTIRTLLIKFAITYLLAALAVGILLHLLNIEHSTGATIAALAGCVLYVCLDFGKKNGRYFTPKERTQALIGMVLISVLYGLVPLIFVPDLFQFGASAMVLVITLLVALLLNTAFTALFMWQAQVMLRKQKLISPVNGDPVG